MELLVIQAAMVLVIIASVIVPGWSIAVLVGAGRSVASPELRRAWTILYGLGWAGIATAIAMVLGTSRTVSALLVLLPVLPGAVVAARRRLRPRPPGRPAVLLHAWALAVAALVGAWGTTFVSDGAYHAAAVEKLARIDGVTPGAISPFSDHDPIPALLVPAWHQLLAFAAQLPGIEYGGLLAMWSAGAACALLFVHVAAACGRVATGTAAGAWGAAVLAPIVLLVPWTDAPPLLRTLGFPGNVVLFVALPAMLATIAALAGRSGQPDRRPPWIAALVLGTAAVCTIHVTYVYHLALIGLGMLATAALLDRTAARRLLLPAAVVAGATAVGVALQLPALTAHPEFGRGTGGEEGATVRMIWEDLLAGDGYAVRGSWFLAQGALYAIGLAAVALVLPLVRRRRIQAVLLVVVPTLVLGAFARISPVAELLAGLGSFPPVARTPRMLPAALAFVVVLGALDARFAARRRAAAVTGAIVAAVLVALAFLTRASRMGEDLGRDHHGLAPGWLFDVLLVVLVAQLAVAAVRARRAGGESAHAAPAATGAPAALTAAVVLAVGVVGAATWSVRAAEKLGERPSHITQAQGLADGGVIDRDTFSIARRLEPGTVVLADPRVSLRIAAVAPVYITSTTKNQLSTPEREQAMQDFLDAGTDDEQRLRYLDDQGVEVIMFPGRSSFVRVTSQLLVVVRVASDLLAGDSGWRAYQTGDELRLYCKGECRAIPAEWRRELRAIEARPG